MDKMRHSFVIVVLIAALALIIPVSAVWPTPKTLLLDGRDARFETLTALQDDASLFLASDVKFVSQSDSKRLQAGLERYHHLIAQRLDARSPTSAVDIFAIHTIEVTPSSDDEKLDTATDYSYHIGFSTAGARVVRITAPSVYGCLYGLETLTQLLAAGRLPCLSSLRVDDAPDYRWRGFMADTGRRFFPMQLLYNLLDTMAANKLNVLHLHASDHCRFSVESKQYPALTQALTGIKAGHYTQANISALIQYAGARGVRVVPEFDVPGHSRGFLPINGTGVDFCTDDATASQLYNDPAGKTLGTVIDLFKEMAQLFEDEYFHIGCDETAVKGRCPLDSTFSFERSILNAVSSMGKTPVGWEEIYCDAQAATNKTVIDAWSRHKAADVTSTGHQVIESSESNFYFTEPAPGGPAGWSHCWYDIATNVSASQRSLVLGGEMSMWSDTYCYISQCGAASSNKPVGAPLFGPDRDDEFAHSIGGMVWPRGYVAAASFWNYNSSANPTSQAFTNAIYALNDDLEKRGSYVCPSNCSCDQLTACGTPYIKSGAGSNVAMGACASGMGTQNLTFNGAQIVYAANPSLCLAPNGSSDGAQIVLAPCDSADAAVSHDAEGRFVFKASGRCMDLNKVTGQVAIWECGTDQPNQAWAYDATANVIVSRSHYSDETAFAGECLAVQP